MEMQENKQGLLSKPIQIHDIKQGRVKPMTATRTLILDRDGVINHDAADFIKSADEWLPIPGSIEAIALASQAGWRVVIATNQSGVGRGLFDEFALAHMHEKLARLVEDAGAEAKGSHCTAKAGHFLP